METQKLQMQFTPVNGQRNLAKIAILFAVMLLSQNIQAQQVQNYSLKQPFSFEENKGQLADENGKADLNIPYFNESGAVKMYCYSSKIRFVFTKHDSIAHRQNIDPINRFDKKRKKYVCENSIVDMGFEGANISPQIQAADKQEGFKNYYLSSCIQGAIRTSSFKTITYKNIYPLIDLLLNCKENGFKYSFIIRPGGKVSDINIVWKGAEITPAEKGFIYKAKLGNLVESAPYSFTQDKQEVTCNSTLAGNIISFKTGNYDHNQNLTIDPLVVWSTYYGGNDYDECNAVSVDKWNNIYIIGTSYSASNVATSGAYQTTGGLGATPYFAKFNNNGKRIWATYYGGIADSFKSFDIGKSIVADATGNIYVTGRTSNSTAIATTGSFQPVYNSPYNPSFNCFLAKFDSSGKRIWGTYFGNSSTAGAIVKVDHNNNVLLLGETDTIGGIATSGAYQTNLNVYWGEPFVVKFTPTGKRLWGTYIGPDFSFSKNTESIDPYGMDLDSKDNVFIVGYVSVDSGWATKGALQTKYGGDPHDGFLFKLDSGGTKRLWATYLGDTDFDGLISVSIDKSDNIYALGVTLYNTPHPSNFATKGAWQPNQRYGWNMPVEKFDETGKRIWGTFIGGSSGDFPQNLTTDSVGSVYATGMVGYPQVWISACSLHKIKTNDAFVSKLSSKGQLLWVTAYGGSGIDAGQDIKVDKKGSIIVVGNTGSIDSVATTGSYQSTFGGTKKFFNPNVSWNYFGDGFLTKFTNYIDDANLHGDSFSCLNASKPYFTDKSACKNYFWVASNGSILSGQYSDSVVVKWSSTGNQTLSCFRSDPSGHKDTLSKKIIVTAVPAAYVGTFQSICLGDFVSIGRSAVSGNTYTWVSSPKGFSSTLANPIIKPKATAIYFLTETNSGRCSKTDSVLVVVNPTPAPKSGLAQHICDGQTITLTYAPKKGSNFHWSSKPDTSINTSDSIYVTKIHNSSTIFLQETIVSTSCAAKDSFFVTVNPLPTVNAGTDKTLCQGDSVQIGQGSPASGVDYSWVSTPVSKLPFKILAIVKPVITTSYILTAKDHGTGCYSIDTTVVTVDSLSMAKFSVKDSLFCLADSLTTYDSSKNAVSYSWSFGDGKSSTSKSPKHLYAKGGLYNISLKVLSTNACASTLSRKVFVDSACAWPGDANYDKKASISDLLAIGLAYKETGSPRIDTTTQWYAHPAINWTKNFKSGANHKHADCNGDGVVNIKDLGAIVRNYGNTHLKAAVSGSGNASDPALYLSITKDSVSVKDTITINMELGTKTKPVKDIYGVCFSITYDPGNTNAAKGIKYDFSNCWIGTPGKDLIYLVKNDSVNGILDIGISRTDKAAVSGYGNIGVLSIITPDNVAGKREVRKEIMFGIQNINSIDASENNVPLYTVNDSVLLYEFKTGINNSLFNTTNTAHIYPNPVNSILHIVSDNGLIFEIRVTNILGETMLAEKTNNVNQTDLPLNDLKAGMYFIDIQTNNGLLRTRFVKQ